MTREALSLRRALTNRPEELRSLALEPVDVAVLDSGIDATHPDLADRIAPALRVDMIEGAATLVEVAGPTNQDVFGHGTAVASLIAKTAPNARIIDIRVLGSDNKGAGDALLAGLTAAVERKIKIINMSLAATAKFAPQLAALCDTAYRQGQIVVAAKRNMPLADNGYPAELSASISVDRMKLESLSRIVYRASTAPMAKTSSSPRQVADTRQRRGRASRRRSYPECVPCCWARIPTFAPSRSKRSSKHSRRINSGVLERRDGR
jgi:hypothetical protein